MSMSSRDYRFDYRFIIGQSNTNYLMNRRLRLIEIHQETIQQSISQRIQQASKFSPLGPPDLLHLTRVKTRTFGKKQIKTSFCFMSGLDIRTPAHLSLFITQLIAYQKQLSNTHGKIQKAILCIYDSLNRIDVHLEVKIPGSLKLSIYSNKGIKLQLTQQQENDYYQTAFYCSVIRALSHRYFPFIKNYEQVRVSSTLQQLFPRMLPILHQKKIKLQSKYLTRSNYSLDLIFQEILIRNLTKTANVGLKVLQEIDSNIGNLMVCCLHQQQFQHKKVIQLTATCLENQTDYQYLKIQVRSLIRLKMFDPALKIIKYLILSCKYNVPSSWELLCRCYFYKGQYKEMMISLNTAKLQEWVTLKQQIPTLMFKNNKGFNVSKPTCIIESSLQSNYCLNFDNEFINRFSKIKVLKLSLVKQEKQKQKQLKTLKLLDRLENLLKTQYKSLGDLFKLLIMFQRVKGWENLIHVRNRIFWLQSDFNTISQVILKKQSFISQSNQQFDPNSDYMEKSMQDIDDIKDIKQIKTQFKSQITVQQPYQQPRQSLEENQEHLGQQYQKSEQQSEIKQVKQIKLMMTENSFDEKDNKYRIEPPQATTKRFQQNDYIPKHVNDMFSQKILCSDKLQSMINSLYTNLSLLLDLESWEEGLKIPGLYTIDRNELVSIMLLKKAFLQMKLLRFRKSQSSLKKALKYSQYDISKLSIQYNLCLLYLEGHKFKACELYMIQMLTTLYNLGLKQYDSLPFWLLKIIRDVIDATGGIKQFQQAIKNWPQKLYKIVWEDALKNIYSK